MIVKYYNITGMSDEKGTVDFVITEKVGKGKYKAHHVTKPELTPEDLEVICNYVNLFGYNDERKNELLQECKNRLIDVKWAQRAHELKSILERRDELTESIEEKDLNKHGKR